MRPKYVFDFLFSNSALSRFHFTQFNCGTLPCDKYPMNREVPCSVCSPQSGKGGSAYIHWGNGACKSDAVALYSGFAATGGHTENGGGANLLCLTGEPNYDIVTSDADEGGARLYGATYVTRAYGLRAHFSSLESSLISCAACFVADSHTALMVPGRRECPSRYLSVYRGYLFSAHYTEKKVNWICIDEDAKNSGSRSGATAKLYPTEIECGSILCNHSRGGYVQNREVSCVVCRSDSRRLASVYTRWGRSDCSSDSVEVYVGQAVGSHYYKQWGSGANVLCLHPVAQFAHHDDGNQDGGRLYGYEYSPGGLMASSYSSATNREVQCDEYTDRGIFMTFFLGSLRCLRNVVVF